MTDITEKDGGPAFACAAENGHQPGMSTWDYFAGQACIGVTFAMFTDHRLSRAVKGRTLEEAIASISANIADAMLKERGGPDE